MKNSIQILQSPTRKTEKEQSPSISLGKKKLCASSEVVMYKISVQLPQHSNTGMPGISIAHTRIYLYTQLELETSFVVVVFFFFEPSDHSFYNEGIYSSRSNSQAIF